MSDSQHSIEAALRNRKFEDLPEWVRDFARDCAIEPLTAWQKEALIVAFVAGKDSAAQRGPTESAGSGE